MTNIDSVLKSRDINYFADKDLSNQSYGFSSSHVWMWELDHKESWMPENWCFWTVELEKTPESPLDYKEIQLVHPKGNQSWIFIGRTDAEAETAMLWPPNVKNWLIGKDPDAGKDWGQVEKGTTEDETVGWHHRLDAHEFEQALGVGDGREASHAVVHGVAKSQTWLSNWIDPDTHLLETAAQRPVSLRPQCPSALWWGHSELEEYVTCSRWWNVSVVSAEVKGGFLPQLLATPAYYVTLGRWFFLFVPLFHLSKTRRETDKPCRSPCSHSLSIFTSRTAPAWLKQWGHVSPRRHSCPDFLLGPALLTSADSSWERLQGCRGWGSP